ncbi:MAG TPA: secretin N-terminal domain-containing protein [Thermoanaerobaculia bacterium]|nr:secretin N-terminal domain-containing protein [Thermoanaerobaculia bacterium]
MRKGILLAAFGAISLFAPAIFAAEEALVKVFILKYRQVEEAALLIRPHLSDAGTVTLTPRLKAITVTDREENLRMIARVIAQFDVPPRGFTFAIKLVRARAEVPAGSIDREIGGMGAKLKSLFQFNDYSLIDSAVMRGIEGAPVAAQLGEEGEAYMLNFWIEPAGSGDQLLLSPFSLSRLRRNAQGRVVPVALYRAPMPVTLNQTLVVGASKEEGSKNALILILLAQETPRAGAEKGTDGQRTVEKKNP